MTACEIKGSEPRVISQELRTIRNEPATISPKKAIPMVL